MLIISVVTDHGRPVYCVNTEVGGLYIKGRLRNVTVLKSISYKYSCCEDWNGE